MKRLALILLLASLAWSKPMSLAWDKNPEPDITGYRLNYSTDINALTPSVTVEGDVIEATLDLPLGEHWFEVRAVAGGMESPPSRKILGVVREPINLGWIWRDGWKVKASSTGVGDFAPELAIDEDLATFWHTSWPAPIDPPHWLEIELPEAANIFALYAFPRPDWKGSNITDYEIQSSADGVTWVTWAKGTWTDSVDLKKAELPVRNTRHLRIVSNGFQASIADLNILGYYGPPENVIPPAPPKPPGKLRVVRIETSANLTDWEPLAFVPLLTDSPARFVRAGISEITP